MNTFHLLEDFIAWPHLPRLNPLKGIDTTTTDEETTVALHQWQNFQCPSETGFLVKIHIPEIKEGFPHFWHILVSAADGNRATYLNPAGI